jgi:hypothetical protein
MTRRDGQPPWWDWLAWRRQYLNDRAWFGFAFVAVGLGAMGPESSWWLGVPVAVVGLCLLVWGLVDRRQKER